MRTSEVCLLCNFRFLLPSLPFMLGLKPRAWHKLSPGLQPSPLGFQVSLLIVVPRLCRHLQNLLPRPPVLSPGPLLQPVVTATLFSASWSLTSSDSTRKGARGLSDCLGLAYVN